MTKPAYLHQLETARNGTNPSVICQVPSGWVFLSNMQFLRGYCILQADPIVESINALDEITRAVYLRDMAIVGDAILEVTDAYRINYAIMGNTDLVLHTHIVPRYHDEPEHLRKGLPWSYPQSVIDKVEFDVERDQIMMDSIKNTILARIKNID
jgi:diadenosine tetraphosphate (Ap4A) HIT family hydrolase